MTRMFTVILLLFCALESQAQKREVVRATIHGGDTIPHIRLEEVTVFGKGRYAARHRQEERRNARLEYNVRKVYPYARLAAEKIEEIENRLAPVHGEAERRRIIREEYNQLMKTFKAPLMKLSVNQGKILMRLIYRETRHTSFAHIREYKGAMNAYFWQSVARLFGHNLKAAYDPQGEDAEIEEIVQKILQGK